jgi:hypothetical protein
MASTETSTVISTITVKGLRWPRRKDKEAPPVERRYLVPYTVQVLKKGPLYTVKCTDKCFDLVLYLAMFEDKYKALSDFKRVMKIAMLGEFCEFRIPGTPTGLLSPLSSPELPSLRRSRTSKDDNYARLDRRPNRQSGRQADDQYDYCLDEIDDIFSIELPPPVLAASNQNPYF